MSDIVPITDAVPSVASPLYSEPEAASVPGMPASVPGMPASVHGASTSIHGAVAEDRSFAPFEKLQSAIFCEEDNTPWRALAASASEQTLTKVFDHIGSTFDNTEDTSPKIASAPQNSEEKVAVVAMHQNSKVKVTAMAMPQGVEQEQDVQLEAKVVPATVSQVQNPVEDITPVAIQEVPVVKSSLVDVSGGVITQLPGEKPEVVINPQVATSQNNDATPQNKEVKVEVAAMPINEETDVAARPLSEKAGVETSVSPQSAPVQQSAGTAVPVDNAMPVAEPSIQSRVVESLRTCAVAVVSAIQVTPALAETGVGEIRIQLANEVLDGSTVRFEADKGDLRVTIYPATQEASQVLQKHLETFQAQLAERVTSWRVNVGVSAWNPKMNFKQTERG